MKKLLLSVFILTLIVTGCGSTPQPSGGVTLTKEKYDELIAFESENEQLKQEIEYLEQRLDDYQLKENGDTGSTGSDGSGSTETSDNNSSTESGTTNQTINEEENASTLSPSEIEKLTLSPFQGDYGLYGYKDQDGNIVIEADFDTATAFQNSQATVTKGGKSGVMTKSGLVTWTNVETYIQVAVEPANDLVEGSDFANFIAEFREALEARNEAKVREHLADDIVISFGGHVGWDDLVSYWSIDEGSEAFYRVLNSQIRYGVVDTSGDGTRYVAPYTFASFPDSMDMYRDKVVTGSSVNVRTRPTTDSEVITQVTYDVVRTLSGDEDGWTKIQLPDGERGFISSQFLKDPLYYRAVFEKVDGKWMVLSFVKGD